MKTLTLTLLGLALSLYSFGQCNYGNDNYLPESSTTYANYLLGTSIAVEAPIKLTHLGMIVIDANDNVEVGVYDDNGGGPGHLITSATATTVEGINEIDVPDVYLPVGTYYFMAVFETNASVSNANTPGSKVWYVTHNCGNPMPDPMENYATYTGKEFAYYFISTPDVTISRNGSFLQVNNTYADNYQWINCSNNTQVYGETYSSFNPVSVGTYACVVSQDGCVDTSECIVVDYLSLQEVQENDFTISPNPSSGHVSLEFKEPPKEVTVLLYDLSGREMYRESFQGNSRIDLDLQLPSGAYTVSMQTSKRSYNSRLLLR